MKKYKVKDLNEKQKGRLDKLYSTAIEGIAGDISNERLWANGAPDEQSARMHLDSIEELESWRENLEAIKDSVGRVPRVSLSDTQKAWLEELYDTEIRESEGDAEWIEVVEELKDGVRAL